MSCFYYLRATAGRCLGSLNVVVRLLLAGAHDVGVVQESCLMKVEREAALLEHAGVLLLLMTGHKLGHPVVLLKGTETKLKKHLKPKLDY